MSINESSMWAAVHRMESASEQMARAAEEITQAVQRFAFLLEPGYGGNGLRLIELLEQTATQPGPDVRGLVSADDVRDACANAVSVFAEETNADQCREVAEYMREVLLAQIAHRQDT